LSVFVARFSSTSVIIGVGISPSGHITTSLVRCVGNSSLIMDYTLPGVSMPGIGIFLHNFPITSL
jgi:hypothetical protein